MQPVKQSKRNFIKLLVLFVAIIIPWIIGISYVKNTSLSSKRATIKLVNFKRDTVPKVNHAAFEILQQNFESPQAVTVACLSCHNQTHKDIMKTSHWNWERDYKTDQSDTIKLGKKNIINNFCIGISSNEKRCTSCHIGYGWEDKHFDFTNGENIDCLICHDKTGTYEKFPSGAGYPVTEVTVFENKTYYPPDYNYIAANVGTPGRENCGACHFVGGGGNNVKHGDIANELNKLSRQVDVHMGIDGANMNCVDCHKTERHNISGNLYSIASTNSNRVSCSQCHTEQAHANQILNQHTKKVACQTCHIPIYAKVSPTKMSWDWSTAGEFNNDGSEISRKDTAGNIIYVTKKGSFVWKKNVEPEYQWFDGRAKHYVLGDKIDTSEMVKLNTLLGNYAENKSKIIPVKVHRGKQIYDSENNYMIVPHLFGKDSTAYWKNFDWDKASRTGMESIDLPYSGKYGFASTEMSWPINHMVAPREESLKCADCHTKNGRLIALNDFYLIARDRNNLLDFAGLALIIGAIIGVIIHATLRILRNKKPVISKEN